MQGWLRLPAVSRTLRAAFMLMHRLQITTLKAEHGKAEAAVESRRQLLRSCDDQLQQLEQELGEIAERKTNATVELKKLEHQVRGLSGRLR